MKIDITRTPVPPPPDTITVVITLDAEEARSLYTTLGERTGTGDTAEDALWQTLHDSYHRWAR